MSLSQDGALVLKLTRLQANLRRELDRSLGVHGISLTEFTVLVHLMSAPNQAVRRIDLAEQVGLSASGVTRLLNPLEKRGLVKKEESPRDARVSLVGLTGGGEGLVADAEQTFNQCADRLLASVTHADREVLGRIAELL